MNRLTTTYLTSLFVSSFIALPAITQESNAEYIKTARDAARWIQSNEVETPEGLVWPADPAKPGQITTDLYSGTPGVILFYLQMYKATGDRQYLWYARKGADAMLYIITNVESAAERFGTGLYVGIAGLGFTLNEAYKVIGEEKYRSGAALCLDSIATTALSDKPVDSWKDTTDIISGISGTGLFLLYAAEEMDRPDALKLAMLAGNHLLSLSKEKHGGLMWKMSEEIENTYPNFSHGTAGVCYFLTSLYIETKESKYLEAAKQGADYLLEIAKKENGTCIVPRFDPDEYEEGEPQLFYMGWCHGPVGTARLFHRLFQATSDEKYKITRDQMAKALLESGIPEIRLPGYWNNLGPCCGNAGIAEFALAMFKETGNEEYLNFSKTITTNLINRTQRTKQIGHALWFHAENRLAPDNLIAQLGYMQGAAGIGMWLLRMDAATTGRQMEFHLPDWPFN